MSLDHDAEAENAGDVGGVAGADGTEAAGSEYIAVYGGKGQDARAEGQRVFKLNGRIRF